MDAAGALPKLAALTALHRAAARAIRKSDEAREAQEHALLAASLIVLDAGTCITKLLSRAINVGAGFWGEMIAYIRNLPPAPILFALFSPPFSPLVHAGVLTTQNRELPSIGEQFIRCVYLRIVAGEEWSQVLKVLPYMVGADVSAQAGWQPS